MKSALPRTFVIFLLLSLLSGCVQPAPGSRPWLLDQPTSSIPVDPASVTDAIIPTARSADSPYFTPTPDAPRTLATVRGDAEVYIVQPGDYLALIAQKYNVDLNTLISANSLVNPNALEVGQVITIPAVNPGIEPSSFKIIPDSELVYGPASSTLNVKTFVRDHDGYLKNYTDLVDEKTLTGAQIVSRICYEYSVNPRLLLALLEYRSGWVTNKNPASGTLSYPMGVIDENRKGLYKQLAWAAMQLNRGYYLWKINALSYMTMTDGVTVLFSPTVNAGTAAVQYLLALSLPSTEWKLAVAEKGLFNTYTKFFGIPFDLAVEPILPADLVQPKMLLPFESGVAWSFTGGPHAGWGDGSAWAALDFGPPGDEFGCFTSNAWITAVANGIIVRAGDGAVVQDLSGDGLEQTGWTILYMHIESRDRVAVGSMLKAGDRIGHPSCEGGYSNGTHLHLARRYNGEWIAADGSLPFVLNGWVSAGDGIEYSGTLTKKGQIVYSWDGRVADNQIQH